MEFSVDQPLAEQSAWQPGDSETQFLQQRVATARVVKTVLIGVLRILIASWCGPSEQTTLELGREHYRFICREKAEILALCRISRTTSCGNCLRYRLIRLDTRRPDWIVDPLACSHLRELNAPCRAIVDRCTLLWLGMAVGDGPEKARLAQVSNSIFSFEISAQTRSLESISLVTCSILTSHPLSPVS